MTQDDNAKSAPTLGSLCLAGFLSDFTRRMKMSELTVGDNVEVQDAGLEMLRRLCPDQPPNHHGRVESIDGDTVMVEFPIGGSYEHSQSSPYPRSAVRKRGKEIDDCPDCRDCPS